ncbi:MAG: DUF3006 domain-containing protein [Peptococcaceae bacterium]|nr:DUF3006 domain-containing protein [Candidatus Syntrophopropionicum ammoniitolerans]
MKVIIDRFEGEFAVVELPGRKTVDMPLELIPPGAKEGDVLSIELNKKETEKRKREAEKLMEDLWE